VNFSGQLFPGGVEIEFNPKDFDGMIHLIGRGYLNQAEKQTEPIFWVW